MNVSFLLNICIDLFSVGFWMRLNYVEFKNN